MRKITLFAFFTALCTVIGLCGCVIVNFTDRNVVRGRGDRELYEIRTGQFSSISVEGNTEIHYYAAERDYITLEIQPNLRDYYVVEVINGNLTIRPTRRLDFNSSRTPVLTVSSPVLEQLTISGACTFTAHDIISADTFTLRISGAGEGRAQLDVERFFANISGTGSFDLSGRADTVDLRLSGTGDLDALSLQSREGAVRLSGTGRVGISSYEHLTIVASGTGSIEYRGSPNMNLSNSGIVSIRQVD